MSFNPGDWGISNDEVERAKKAIKDHEDEIRKQAEKHQEELKRLAEEAKDIPSKLGSNPPPAERMAKFRAYQVDELLVALGRMPAFNPLSHIDHLKFHINVSEDNYQKTIKADLYGENLDPRRLDLWNRRQGDLERFKFMTIGLGLRGHSEHKFNTFPASDFDAKYYSQCNDIAMICYRHDLDNYIHDITSQNLDIFDPEAFSYIKDTRLEAHFLDEEFCRAYARKVLRPEFVNSVLLQQFVAGGGNTVFPEAVAYMYERCRPTLSKMPETQKVADDSVRAQSSTTSFNNLATFSAQAHWKDTAAQHPGLKDNPSALARFATASKPVTWLDEYKLQGPYWPDLGQVLGKAWSLQGDWADQVGPALRQVEDRPKHGEHDVAAKWYGKDLILYLIGGGEVLGPNNSDLFNVHDSVGWEFDLYGQGFSDNLQMSAMAVAPQSVGQTPETHHAFRTMPLMVRSHFDSASLPNVDLHPGMSTWEIGEDSNHALPSIRLHQGKVLVNDQFCKHATVDGSHLHWARELPGDNSHGHSWEHGSVLFDMHQLTAFGTVGLGTKENIVSTTAVATTIEPVKLVLKVEPLADAHDTKEQALAATSSTDKWEHFWNMELQAEFNPGGAITGTLVFPDIVGRDQAKSPETPNDLALYDTPVVSVDQSGGNFKWIAGVDSSLAEAFFGAFAEKYCADETVKALGGPAFKSFGVEINSFDGETTGWIQGLTKQADGTYIAGKYRAIRGGWPPEVVVMALAANTSATDHHPVPDTTKEMVTAMFFNTLSITGLLTMGSQVKSEDIQKASLEYLMKSAEYHRGDEEVALFGSRKATNEPLLPAELKNSLSDDCKAWLRKYLGKATIINSVVHNEEKYAKLLNEKHQDKMSFWWDGGAKDCLAPSPEYARMMEIAFAKAYEDLVPAAKAYKADAKDWGATFFNACKAPNQIKMMDLEILITGNQGRLNQYSLLLNYLDKQAVDDKRVGYGQRLYHLILEQQIMKLTQGSGTLNEKWPSFIADFWAKLVIELKKTTAADYDSLRTLIKEIEEEMAKDAADGAQHSAGDLLMKNQALARMISMITENMMAARRMSKADINGTDYAKALTELEDAIKKSDKVKAWMKVKLPHIKALTAVLLQGFTLGQSIFYIAKWNKLNGEQRALAIANLVESTVKTLKDFGLAIAVFRDPGSSPMAIRVACIKRWQKLGGRTPDVTLTNENGINENIAPAERIEEPANLGRPAADQETFVVQVGNGEGSTVQATENIIKEFDVANVIAEGVSVACNIVVIICMSMDINEEIKNGSQRAGIVAMDIITVTVMSLQSTLGVIAMGMQVMGIECVMVPYAAAGLAVVSGIMMMVEMMVDRDPPPPGPDKIQQYIEKERDSGFFTYIPARPSTKLNYIIKQEDTTMTCMDTTGVNQTHNALKFSITIQDLGGTKPRINNWQIRFMAGEGESCPFANPILYKAHKDGAGANVPDTIYNPFTTSCNWSKFIWGGPERASTDSNIVKMVKPAKDELNAQNEPLYPVFDTEVKLELTGVKNDKYKGECDSFSSLQVFEILGDKQTDGAGIMDRKVEYRIKK